MPGMVSTRTSRGSCASWKAVRLAMAQSMASRRRPSICSAAAAISEGGTRKSAPSKPSSILANSLTASSPRPFTSRRITATRSRNSASSSRTGRFRTCRCSVCDSSLQTIVFMTPPGTSRHHLFDRNHQDCPTARGADLFHRLPEHRFLADGMYRNHVLLVEVDDRRRVATRQEPGDPIDRATRRVEHDVFAVLCEERPAHSLEKPVRRFLFLSRQTLGTSNKKRLTAQHID